MSEHMDRARFIRSAAALGLVTSGGAFFATPSRGAAVAATAAAPTKRGLIHRGVSYDTGTSFGVGWPLSREVWSTRLMQGEIRAVSDQLHCNSVTVIGTDVGRLVATSTEALERGLHVWLQPRLFDRRQAAVLDHLARTAREAERLRKRYSEVSLNVGCEASLFTPGMIAGKTWQDRIATMYKRSTDWTAVQKRLNVFLREAGAVARAHFKGKLTYAAGPWEAVDWRPFDFVGLDYYAFHRERAKHVRELNSFRRWKKPIVICEFGTCAHLGAPEKEGGGWDIVDWSNAVPRVIGNPVRSERVQADHIADMLEVFESETIHAAYVYTFIQPDLPHSPNPRDDLDLASFGVVKAIRADHDDPRSPYSWQPKEAFHVLADHNRAARRHDP